MNEDTPIPQTHLSLLTKAKQLRSSGDYEGALHISNLLLAENSSNIAALVVKASLLALLGRSDEALSIYERVGQMELAPDFAFDYLSHICLIQRDKGDFNGAILTLKKALEYSPNNWDAIYNLGFFYYRIRDWNSALVELHRGLLLHPKPEAYSIIGCTYLALGDQDNAIKSFRSALELEEDYDEAHFNLGVTLFDLGDHEGARYHLNRAIAQDVAWKEKLPPKYLTIL